MSYYLVTTQGFFPCKVSKIFLKSQFLSELLHKTVARLYTVSRNLIGSHSNQTQNTKQ